jgi:hypothetical protein
MISKETTVYIVLYHYDYEGYSLDGYGTKAFFNEADALKYKEELEAKQSQLKHPIDVIIETINVE